MAREWLELSVSVPHEHADAIANFLIDSGAPGLLIEEAGPCAVIKSYWPDEPPTEALERFCTDRGWWQDVRLSATWIDDENWAENWKKHFEPVAVGSKLWVCPPWSVFPPPGRLAIVIDPGMAFGTGHHASTRGCLALIDRRLQCVGVHHALDIGTGSGILAIALAKLGAKTILAADIDPCARQVARDNAEANAVAASIEVTNDWQSTAAPFDLIVANLFANLLVELSASLTRKLGPGGMLICSGFLETDERDVRDACERTGLVICDRVLDEGWVTLAFGWSAQDG